MKRYNWLRTHEMFQESDKISNNIETQNKEQSNVLPNYHSFDCIYTVLENKSFYSWQS